MVPNAAGKSIVYVLGGIEGDGSGEGNTGYDIRIYNPATNTWGTGSGARVDVFNTNGVGAIGTKLYFSGGYLEDETTFSNRLWAYDVVTNRLVRKTDMPKFTADGVTGVIDGKLYVLPGACSGDGWPNPGYCETEDIRQLFRYSPATNTWAARRAAPHFHKRGAAGVINGKFYVAGGIKNFNDPVADLDVYDPATNSWKTLAPMPRGGAAIGAVLGGKLFVISGPNAYFYNPLTNRWRTISAPRGSHSEVVRVFIEGDPHLVAVGHGRPELYTP